MGAFALSCAELEQESHVMTGGVKKTEDRSSSEDEPANNEEPLDDLCDTNIKQANYSTVKDDSPPTDSGNEGNLTVSLLLASESLSQHSNEANDMEVINELAKEYTSAN